MLAENVSWVVDTIQVIHGNDLGCDSLAYSMERKGVMTLVELGMGNGRTVNHGLVVTKK
jgi:formylmethanofuran dehydrogenase subunit E